MKKFIKIDNDKGYEKAMKMACHTLKNGGVIAIPTDTIYGICSSLSNSNKLFDVKERNHCKPLGIFVPDIESIESVAVVPENLKGILKELLPGPITVLLKRSPSLVSNFNPGINSVGVRIPECKFVQDLVKLYGEPIAQTSANKSGAILNPTSIHHFSDIWEDINLIVDGDKQFLNNDEDNKNHPGSTIIDLTEIGYFQIVRDGVIKDRVEKVLTKFGLNNINNTEIKFINSRT
uniref:Threonylcarbamoyl-AMP synthase n=1 Tax=Parastrongyloides trichosuri TaxID=131310 RepID=A0A0N4Z285_PARTI